VSSSGLKTWRVLVAGSKLVFAWLRTKDWNTLDAVGEGELRASHKTSPVILIFEKKVKLIQQRQNVRNFVINQSLQKRATRRGRHWALCSFLQGGTSL
jgi:hypothetical protein